MRNPKTNFFQKFLRNEISAVWKESCSRGELTRRGVIASVACFNLNSPKPYSRQNKERRPASFHCLVFRPKFPVKSLVSSRRFLMLPNRTDLFQLAEDDKTYFLIIKSK